MMFIGFAVAVLVAVIIGLCWLALAALWMSKP